MSQFPGQIPFAVQHTHRMPTHGTYNHGFPIGAVVHYTNGAYAHGAQDAHNVIDYGVTQGYAYLAIGRDGVLVQAHDVTEWGYHCGVSAWPGLGSGLNSQWIGIEICNAGKLRKTADGRFMTDWGAEIPATDVRHIDNPRYPGEIPGHYHAYSPEQEKTLIKLLLWLRHAGEQSGNPVFQLSYVGGHDEIRAFAGKPGDKQDPGGSLSMGMKVLREQLRAIWLAPDRDAQLRAMGVIS